MTADDGVVVAVLPDDEVELGAECLGELDATQLEATHPGGHFVGIEREEDVAELLDFALLVGAGAATLEAVQLLVIEVLDTLGSGSMMTSPRAMRRALRYDCMVAARAAMAPRTARAMTMTRILPIES